jgi:hypothetical protein
MKGLHKEADELINPLRALVLLKRRGTNTAIKLQEATTEMQNRAVIVEQWPMAEPPPGFVFTPAQQQGGLVSVSSRRGCPRREAAR